MKRTALALATVCLVAAGLSGQSNDLIDEILGQDPATREAVLTIALQGNGVDFNGSATAHAAAEGWLNDSNAELPITLGELSHVLLQAGGGGGSLLYRLFSGPRYAAREAFYNGWIPSRRAPGSELSGEEAIQLIGNFLSARDQEALR